MHLVHLAVKSVVKLVRLVIEDEELPISTRIFGRCELVVGFWRVLWRGGLADGDRHEQTQHQTDSDVSKFTHDDLLKGIEAGGANARRGALFHSGIRPVIDPLVKKRVEFDNARGSHCYKRS